MSSFKPIKLNDGRHIPGIGFGTWKIPQDVTSGQVDQGLGVGFDHIDTAQVYRNEEETGKALRESGLKREEVWVTTKYSGSDPGLGIRATFEQSLRKLGVTYVDLYLIHSPRLVKDDIAGAWKEFELLKKEGLAKSIGVSNFQIEDLKVLLESAEIKPAVNQILFHPYVYSKQKALVDFQNEHGIVTEAYSALTPLTSRPGGPVDKPVNAIAKRLDLKAEQVLLAWVAHKGAVIVTTSSKKERLEGYLAVGQIQLTSEDVQSIDDAGAQTDYRKLTRFVTVCAVCGLAGWMWGWRSLSVL